MIDIKYEAKREPTAKDYKNASGGNDLENNDGDNGLPPIWVDFLWILLIGGGFLIFFKVIVPFIFKLFGG